MRVQMFSALVRIIWFESRFPELGFLTSFGWYRDQIPLYVPGTGKKLGGGFIWLVNYKPDIKFSRILFCFNPT